jgi:hypothetical protein
MEGSRSSPLFLERKMQHKEKINELGLMGEKVIINYLSSIGRIVEQSIDKYDSTKDMLCDGRTVEVKTQVPFILQKALTFRTDQLRKCRNVDELYFVTVPAPEHSYKWSGWIFKVDPKAFTHRTYKTKKGVNMILVDIEQEAVVPVCQLSEENISQLRKYTVSSY